MDDGIIYYFICYCVNKIIIITDSFITKITTILYNLLAKKKKHLYQIWYKLIHNKLYLTS